MPAKRSAPPPAEPAAPKARQSKLAKEHGITAQEENEIKEAFAMFSQPYGGEKDGVIPITDVRKAMIALGIPPAPSELKEFISILDPEDEGYATYPSFVGICALKILVKKDDSGAMDEEVEQAYNLFTNGTKGPITMGMLKRVAAALKEDVSDDLLRDMILEANGGAGVGQGVGRDEFANVMRRAGVWR